MPGPRVYGGHSGGKSAVLERLRAGHVPPLPCGKRQTSGVRKAALIRRCGATFPQEGKA